jgi:small GTP-binding protein
LLNKLTSAKSDIAAYSFTTLSAVPGLMQYKSAKIQIIDVPGLVSGAASGRGRGKEVLTMLRSADLILILVDSLYPQHYKAILDEVYQTGIRINQEEPDVRITKKERGGINISSTMGLTKINNETIEGIAKEMKLSNCDIWIREDIDADQLIDVIEGGRIYTKSLTVLTKIDLTDKEQLRRLRDRINPDIAVSAEKDIRIEELKQIIYDKMEFIRIFLKEVGKSADMEEPLIMFKGCTIKDVCSKLHRDFIDKFKYARLWGTSAKFDGQIFKRLDKELADKDVLELHMR